MSVTPFGPPLSTPWVPLWPLTAPSVAGWKGQWFSDRAYVAGDLVVYAGAAYQALAPSTGVVPTGASLFTWLKLADTLAAAKAFYRLADTGATTVDDSGYGGTGTFQGGVTKDVAGASAGSKCVELNGSTGYITVPNNSANGAIGVAGWTMAAWLYVTAVRNTAGMSAAIFAKDHTTGNLPFVLGYGPEAGGPINNGIWAGRFNGSTWSYIWDPNPLALTTWAHYVATQDATTMRLYRNGALVASAAITPVGSNPNQLLIGRRWDVASGAQSYFPGRIDDARLWAAPLSATEVAALYAEGAK
jgi:Concanavalin A-like lectin/glucanases superfamily